MSVLFRKASAIADYSGQYIDRSPSSGDKYESGSSKRAANAERDLG
jgi:hypothetical protein